jgi:hypothetical protein
MALVANMAQGNIPLASGIRCWRIFKFIFANQRLYFVNNICTYTHMTA